MNESSGPDANAPSPDGESHAPKDTAANPKPAAASGWPVKAALTAALLALAGVAVLAVWQYRILEARRDRVEDARASQAESLEELAGEVAAERGRLERLGTRLDQVDARTGGFQALREDVRAMERELGRLEQQLGERLDAMDERLDVETPDPEAFRRRVLMHETLALLRLGQDRAELAGDRVGAESAYRAAETRLAGVDDPRLGPVRRQLASELTALEAHTPVDWRARQGRLQGLADDIDEWPVRGPETQRNGDAAEGGSDETQPGLWGRLTGALGGLVRIERSQPEWLTPVQASWLRAGLNVRFQIAELAAAEGDAEAWRSALDDLRATMDSGLDTSDARVARALELLDELAQLPATGGLPELGEARRRLRNLVDAS